MSVVAVTTALVLGAFTAGAAAPAFADQLDRHPGQVPAPGSGASAPEFPPGSWQGDAVVTGTISIGGGQATVTHPAPFTFSVTIGPRGTVASGSWMFGPADEVVSAGAGQGMGTASSSGTIGGSAATLTLSGQAQFSGSVSVDGTSIPLNTSTPFSGGSLQPTDLSCGTVAGELVFVNGIAKYPFTAHLVGGKANNQQALEVPRSSDDPDRVETMASISPPLVRPMDRSLDAEANQLIVTIDNLTNSPLGTNGSAVFPAALSLLPALHAFHDRLFTRARCDRRGNLTGAHNKALYRKLQSHLAKLLAKLLAVPSAYSAADLSQFFFVAQSYELLPSLVPEFYAALSAKLGTAAATTAHADCGIIRILAAGLEDLSAGNFNFTSLADRANACSS